LLPHSGTLRTSRNQTKGKKNGANPKYGFEEQPRLRSFAEFLATAELHAMLKPQGLKGVSGKTVRSAADWPLRAGEGCLHIALTPGHRLFRIPVQAKCAG
jgi:hypothetical protein